jgi:glycosyltransferase involved in cell wall biosynthesis
MNAPLVSICLPNLNTFPYLRERLDTILGQTYTNWELIVIDSFSNDGAWELFQELARKDRRVSIAQAPRGLYESWNKCIERARGQYVYIATSDDTMAPDCLEKLVAALEEHEDCDLASCTLEAIDSGGAPLDDPTRLDATVFAHSFPGLLKKGHVRRAPFDGLLHLTGSIIHLSITELLIRRSLFSRIGCFETRWGSIGDINWEMKAGLVANIVHVPETYATFRVHPTQATAAVDFQSVDYARRVEEMLQDAVRKCESCLAPEVVTGLNDHWLEWTCEMRAYYSNLRNLRSALRRRVFQILQIRNGRKSAGWELIHRLRGLPKWPDRAPGEIRSWLESLGFHPVMMNLGHLSKDEDSRGSVVQS